MINKKIVNAFEEFVGKRVFVELKPNYKGKCSGYRCFVNELIDAGDEEIFLDVKILSDIGTPAYIMLFQIKDIKKIEELDDDGN